MSDMNAQTHEGSPEIGWYHTYNNAQLGPVSFSQLRDFAASGRLDRFASMVWREGMASWHSAHQVRGLFQGPPPPPLDTVPSLGVNRAASTVIVPKLIPESAVNVIVATRLAGEKQADVEVKYQQALYQYKKLADCFDQTILPAVRKVMTNDQWNLVTSAELDVLNRGIPQTKSMRSELEDRVEKLYTDLISLEIESIIDDSISVTKAFDMHNYLEKELARFRKSDVWLHQSIARYQAREKRSEAERQQKIAAFIDDFEQSQAEFELLGLQIDQQLTQIKWNMRTGQVAQPSTTLTKSFSLPRESSNQISLSLSFFVRCNWVEF